MSAHLVQVLYMLQLPQIRCRKVDRQKAGQKRDVRFQVRLFEMGNGFILMDFKRSMVWAIIYVGNDQSIILQLGATVQPCR